MRLSPFHIQLAKEFALGKESKQILQDYPLSDSRLSVIKANPLFRKEIERQRAILDDKYSKTIEYLEEQSLDVAKEMVGIVKNPAAPANVRSQTAENILNRVAMKTGKASGQLGQELVFEQLLRVTKRTNASPTDDSNLSFDPESAFEELTKTLEPSKQEDDLIDVTPDPVSFTRELPPEKPVSAVGDNGDGKKFKLSPRLRAVIDAGKTH